MLTYEDFQKVENDEQEKIKLILRAIGEHKRSQAYIKAVESVGADVVGSNCGRGIESFAPICKRMREATQLPIWMKGNAGLPQTVDGVTTYAQTAEAFADGAIALLDEGATFIGGCCGTTPAFIAELRRRIDARG